MRFHWTKYVLRLVLMGVVLFLLSSCGYKDIDKRFFVVGIGVDKSVSKEKAYKVILKLAIPTVDIKNGNDQFAIVTEETNSITEAIRKMKSRVDKELDFGHAKIIVFGNKLESKDIGKLMDWFIRRRDIQKIAWVGIGKPSAKEVLNLKPKSEQLPSNVLFQSFGKTGTESAYIVSEYLFDFRKRMTERGLDGVLPIIEINGNEKLFSINKAAVFDKQGHSVLLDSEETKMLNALMNRTTKADVEVENENIKFYISAGAIRTDYNIQTPRKQKPFAVVEVKADGIIEELLNRPYKERPMDYEKIAEKKMEEKIVDFLVKLQKERVDPLGLGLLYRSRHYNKNDWEEWESIYPDINFKVAVDITLRGTGSLKL